MRKGIDVLDDGPLLHIFSKLSNYREVAKLSLVCRRWRELRWSVSRIYYEISVNKREQLRAQENILFSVLYRSSIRAPGSLKELHVHLHCNEAAELTGHWLLCAPSLKLLSLSGTQLVSGRATIYNAIMCMDQLERLTVYQFCLSPPPKNILSVTLRNLRSCKLHGASSALLEAILATYPALKQLDVTGFSDVSPLRVTSASLITFSLKQESSREGDAFKVLFDAPELRAFDFTKKKESDVSIEFQSENLLVMWLHACKLRNRCKDLSSLELSGFWKVDELVNAVTCAPTINKLCLDDIEVSASVEIDKVIATPLVRLTELHLRGRSVEAFKAGKLKLEVLQVHVWPTFSNMSLVKDLLDVHKVSSIVVHCKEVARWPSLSDLLLVYPDRITVRP